MLKLLLMFLGITFYLSIGQASTRLCATTAVDIKSQNLEYSENLLKAVKIRNWFSKHLGAEFDSIELTDFLGLASLAKQVKNAEEINLKNTDIMLRGVFGEIALQLFSSYLKLSGDRITIGNNLHADYWLLSSYKGKFLITGFQEIKSGSTAHHLNNQVSGFYRRLFDPNLEIIIDGRTIDRNELYIQTKYAPVSVQSMVPLVKSLNDNDQSFYAWIHSTFGPSFMTIIMPMAARNHDRWVKNIPNDNSSNKVLYEKHYPLYKDDFLALYLEFKRIFIPRIYKYNKSKSFKESTN